MKYTIRTVAALTGLSQYTIRAWERRHQVTSPERTGTNRRQYGDEDVYRLKLLKQAISAGQSIGQAASFSNEELEKLNNQQISKVSSIRQGNQESLSPNQLLDECLDAIRRLDENELRDTLTRALAIIGANQYIEQFVLPVLEYVEHGWVDNTGSIAQEHMVSAVLRSNLEQLRNSIPNQNGAPRLLVTTPTGQMHEIGALIISVVAKLESWQVTYLGPNLPAKEIVAAVKQSGANALALSLVYPTDDPEMIHELTSLRNQLGQSFPLFVGGRAATSYLSQAEELNLQEVQEFDKFRDALHKFSKG